LSRFFGRSEQAAYVVPGIEQAIERMLTSGVGPVFVMRRVRLLARYRGEQNALLITVAFVYSGDIQYEFVEQHDDTPSAYREFLDRHPGGGFHHVAHFSEDFGKSLRHAREFGTDFEIVQEFITPDGAPFEIYLQPVGVTDPLVTQLSLTGPLQTFFADMRQAAAEWDGRDPVRDAIALLPAEMRPPTEPEGLQ
jgi:catechol 2,3-dioxygenase-like lactoylglutathione lyase family enzyme